MSDITQTVERLNELHKQTTQGEWFASPSGLRDHFDGVYLEHKDGLLIAETYFSDTEGRLENASNTQFIAESHNAWPAIAAELERLRNENLEWLRAARLIQCSDNDASEQEGDKLLSDLRTGNSSLDTPLPVVEKLLKDMDAMRADIARFEQERKLFAAISITDATNRECGHQMTAVELSDRETMVERLREKFVACRENIELTRLREFEAAVRDVKKYGDLDRWTGEIDVAIDDLDGKRAQQPAEKE